MSDEIAEVVNLVEKAQAKGTFSLADAIKGVGYPSDSVDVYLDIEAAYELSKLNQRLLQETDPAISEPLEEEAKALADKVLKSKITFNMRGIDQRQVELIEKQTKDEDGQHSDESWKVYMCALVAANIVSVTDADGNEDSHKFTTEEVLELRSSMPSESWGEVISTMQKLTLATGYFRGLTDAGFLQKS
jgi:hypothetical protein